MTCFQSVKERIGALNGLGCLVQALEKQLVTIDLENESTVTGIIQEVDGHMNVVLNEAQVVNLDGYCQHCELVYIRARTIRYIHIPKQLSVRETISNYLKKSTSNRRRPPEESAAGRFRQNKLLRRQQELKANVAKIKESQTKSESNA